MCAAPKTYKRRIQKLMRQDGIIELLKCIFEFIAKSMIHEFTKTYMIARLAA
jgi:hypothetical protein